VSFLRAAVPLDNRGLIVRQGTLVDASPVDAAVKRPKPPA
jgi:hypothetical protein